MARRWSFWMPPLEHGFIRWLDDHYRCGLTPAGRALMWGLVAASVLRLGTISSALYWVLAALTAVLASAVFIGQPFRPQVALTRRIPPPPSAGDTWSYEVEVVNTSRRIIRDLVIEERALPAQLRPAQEPVVIDRLEPGESSRVRLELVCHRRGAYVLGRLQAASTFPSGLVKVARRVSVTDQVLVCPRFVPLERFDVPAGRVHQPGGIPVASRVGEAMEFAGLREWRDGDRPRDVHWPAFARTGRLVVREFQEEHFARLALVLDVQTRSHKDVPVLERTLSLAAAIADALARQEYIIDIFAAGDTVHRFQAGRALAHVENILELLACIEPGDHLNAEALAAAIVPEAARLSAVIFVMTGWDALRAGVVETMRAQGVVVRVLCAREGVTLGGLGPAEVVSLP